MVVVAATVPKGIKGQGYNVHCSKCNSLLRASTDRGTKNYPQEDKSVFTCSPCHTKKGSK